MAWPDHTSRVSALRDAFRVCAVTLVATVLLTGMLVGSLYAQRSSKPTREIICDLPVDVWATEALARGAIVDVDAVSVNGNAYGSVLLIDGGSVLLSHRLGTPLSIYAPSLREHISIDATYVHLSPSDYIGPDGVTATVLLFVEPTTGKFIEIIANRIHKWLDGVPKREKTVIQFTVGRGARCLDVNSSRERVK